MVPLGAEMLLPDHGWPVFGAGRIRELLTTTAEFLTLLEQQTLALMNKGCTLDECLHALEIPQRLLEKPYLQPIYDDPSFLVRMVWRCYGGWWDGEFDHVLPAPRSAQARVELVGGTGPVLERAQRLLAEGQYALACHLVEAAYHAAPTDPRVHQVRVEVYRAASQRQSSSMARKLLHHAALASEQLKCDLAGETLDVAQVTQFSGVSGDCPQADVNIVAVRVKCMNFVRF